MGLFFIGRASPSSLHYLLALRLSSPLRVRLFSPRGRRWLRGTRRRLRRGGGSFGWVGLPASPLPGWLSNNSWRLRWGFLWMPISSGLLGDGVDWLRLRNRLWRRLGPQNLLPLVQLLLPPLLEKRGEKMELLLRGGQLAMPQ